MISRNFITDREVDDNEGQKGEEDKKVDRESKEWEEYKTEATEELSTTKNMSPPGPDGMN